MKTLKSHELVQKVEHVKHFVSAIYGVHKKDSTPYGLFLNWWIWKDVSLNYCIWDTFCKHESERYYVVYAIETMFSIN